MQHANASKTLRHPSLVETINQGFGAVNRHLWLLAIPLLVDLYYWLGPRISAAPLFERLASASPQSWDTLRQQFDGQFGAALEQLDLRLFAFLPFVRPLAQTLAPSAPWFEPQTWYIGSVVVLLGALVLINIAGLASVTLYLSSLAAVLRKAADKPLALGRIGRAFVMLACIVGLFLGTLLVTLVPFLVVAVVAALASPIVGQLVVFFWATLCLWLMFVAWFSFDAVVISDVGPLKAVRYSFAVVRHFFWGSLGLLVLSRFITLGLGIVWQWLAVTTGGLLVAMVGSAYIGAGLAAAHVIFYRDRAQQTLVNPLAQRS